LLTLWFNHGAAAEVERALEEGFQHVSIDTWLVVIPQIIARIHSPSAPVRNLIHSLLIRIGRHHPQVCVSKAPAERVVFFRQGSFQSEII
jgi:serine/threonine-protein kinase mTOR